MKKFYTLILGTFLFVSASQAQVVFSSDFSNWNDSVPNDWYGSKTNLWAQGIIKDSSDVMYGEYSVQLINTPSSHRRFTSMPIMLDSGNVYDLEVWVKGKGHIRGGYYNNVTDGYSYTSYDTTISYTSSYTIFSRQLTVNHNMDSAEIILSIRNTDSIYHHLILDSLVLRVAEPDTSSPDSGDMVSIYDIQYTTDVSGNSPYMDSIVTTSGIVTAVDNGSFYIQDSASAWNGLFVFTNSYTPSLGDNITITGLITEYFNLTELKDITSMVVNSTGNTLPTPINLTSAEVSNEKYEGVLVKVSDATCTAVADQLGAWSINDGSGDVFIDDDIYPFIPTLDSVYSVTGPVAYSFSLFRIIPRDMNDVEGPTNSGQSVSIYDIQYTTNMNGQSPLLGNIVTVTGVVTGIMPTGEYFIQDDDAAWSGIYVYDNNNNPSVGDEITITGTVDEFFDATQIENVTSFAVNSTGNAAPTPVMVSQTGDLIGSSAEKYEHVLVTTSGECTSELDNFDEWKIDDGSGFIYIADDLYLYDQASQGAVYQVTGIVNYSFSQFRVLPRDANDVVEEASSVNGIIDVEYIDVYPNPSNGIININVTNNGSSAIYDINGKLVYAHPIVNGVNTFDLSTLDKGVYFLEVQTDTMFRKAKLVIQ